MEMLKHTKFISVLSIELFELSNTTSYNTKSTLPFSKANTDIKYQVLATKKENKKQKKKDSNTRR